MTNFDHVVSTTVRDICAGTMATTEPAIAYALGYTAACLDNDKENEDISFEVSDAREASFTEAKLAFAHGDIAASVTALRRVWSI